MSGATDRLPRLLALVPWLLAHPGTPVAEVARVFGVSEKQVRADLSLVFLCGLPGHGPGDLIDVVYAGERVTLSNAETIARPLRLTGEEALALVVGLRALADVPGLGADDATARALAKVETAAGAAADAARAAGGQPPVAVATEGEPALLATVRGALDGRRRVHLRYYVPGRDEATERDVDPMRVVIAGGRAYLEGWCRRVEDVRLFRLDRVFALEVLDTPAAVPEQARPRDLDNGLFRPGPEDELVTLLLDPPARWVADYYPCEHVEERPDGGLRVSLRTPDTSWVRRLVLRLGGAGRVVEPAELSARVRADAAAALAAYEAG